MTLRPGTLYGALDRLAAEGLLEADREEVVNGRLRRYYRLTDAGAAVLEQEAARLQHNADAARGGSPGASRPSPLPSPPGPSVSRGQPRRGPARRGLP